jgi:hypothetical protein
MTEQGIQRWQELILKDCNTTDLFNLKCLPSCFECLYLTSAVLPPISVVVIRAVCEVADAALAVLFLRFGIWHFILETIMNNHIYLNSNELQKIQTGFIP